MSSPTAQTPDQQQPLKATGNYAFLVAAGIMLSRIAGLIRDRVFAHYLGNSVAAGAFKAALRIPNFMQNLFGEGVLSASFIPIYSRLLSEQKEELANRIAGVVGSLLALFTALIVLVGVLLTPAFVTLVAPGFSGEALDLTIAIVRILFPSVGLLVLSAWCLGILNSHRQFFISYTAPVLWNFAMIGALVFASATTTQDELAIRLAWGAMVGSFLQFGIQFIFVLRIVKTLKISLDVSISAVRDVFRNALPVFIGRGVVQISAYIDGMLASFLGPGSVACIAYAQTIYLLPVSLFGMSVAAAELPEMSRVSGPTPEAQKKLGERISRSQRRIAFFVVPSVVAFIFIGNNIVSALYQTGQFGHEDTLFVWYVLMGSSIGLLASTWGRLLSSAFYAIQDTRTPLKFALARVTLTGALGWLFAFPLRPALIYFLFQIIGFHRPDLPGVELGLGSMGLTISAGLAGWIEFLLLRKALRRRISGIKVPTFFLVKVWSSALGAGLITALVNWYDWLYQMPKEIKTLLGYNLLPLYTTLIYGVLYLFACWLLKVEELSTLPLLRSRTVSK